MKIAIGADHAGYDLKEKLKKHLQEQGYEVVDVGAHSYDKNDDYPDFARGVADLVGEQKVDRGILVCDSGIGVDIVANKTPGVRSALVHSVDLARRTREHNDTNVLSLGSMLVDEDTAVQITRTWLETDFTGEERHARRIAKIEDIERSEISVHAEEAKDDGDE